MGLVSIVRLRVKAQAPFHWFEGHLDAPAGRFLVAYEPSSSK